MAFTADEKFAPLEQKVWLATPTMHGEELTYMTEAYATNWPDRCRIGLLIKTLRGDYYGTQ